MAGSRVSSFDVFDTMLTRTVGDPADVWPIVGARLVSDGVTAAPPAAWAAARRACESALTRSASAPPTLRRIHERVAVRLDYDASHAAKAASVEIEVERQVIRPLPGAAALLAEARRRSETGSVTFVSDTPLSSTLVTELLDRVGLWRAGDACFVSCEQGASKRDGGLFRIVAHELGAEPSTITHVGDTLLSDVARARQAGWRARHRARGRLTRYERALVAHGDETDGVTSRLAAAARLARTAAVERGVDAAAARVASGVMAPMLVGFATWLLYRARSHGLGRLYFLARDGEVMLDVARRLGPIVAPEVELRYLHSSRRAWWQSDAAPATGAGAPPGPLDAGTEARRVRMAIDYLEQEGLADGTPAGVVDIGFRGTMSVYLEALLARRGHPLPRAYFYLALNPEATEVSEPVTGDRQHAWLYDCPRGLGAPPRMHGQVPLLETLCAGTHGSVTGYRRDGERIVPVLQSERNECYVAWGLGDLRDVVGHAVDAFVADVAAVPPVDLAAHVWEVLDLFWSRPTPDEARWWGDSPFEYRNDGHGAPIGERVTVRSAVAHTLAHRQLKLRHRQSWLAGSALRSPYPMRAVLQTVRWWRAYGPPLRRIPARVRWELAARMAARARR